MTSIVIKIGAAWRCAGRDEARYGGDAASRKTLDAGELRPGNGEDFRGLKS